MIAFLKEVLFSLPRWMWKARSKSENIHVGEAAFLNLDLSAV